MEIVTVRDWSGPLVEIRNSLDPLSRALQSRDPEAEQIAQRIRRCLSELMEMIQQ